MPAGSGAVLPVSGGLWCLVGQRVSQGLVSSLLDLKSFSLRAWGEPQNLWQPRTRTAERIWHASVQQQVLTGNLEHLTSCKVCRKWAV